MSNQKLTVINWVWIVGILCFTSVMLVLAYNEGSSMNYYEFQACESYLEVCEEQGIEPDSPLEYLENQE